MRASIKRAIASGNLDAATIIAGEEQADLQRYADEIPIGKLLEQTPGYGPSTAQALLEELEIPSDRALYRLAPRTRRDLAARIQETR